MPGTDRNTPRRVLPSSGNGDARHLREDLKEAASGDGEGERKSLSVGSDVEIARRVSADLAAGEGGIVYAEGAFWRYDGVKWVAIPDHELRIAVHAYDGASVIDNGSNQRPVRLSKSRIDSVLHECAALRFKRDFFNAPAIGINCSSGFIRFENDGTPRLEPHHREHRARHVLQGRWRDDAVGCPPATSLLARLANGSFQGDPEADAKITLLAEICGAAALGIATRLKQPRAVVLLGRTAENGKSQFIELARGLLPPTAISSVPASKMSDDRHVIGLAGKLLNTSDELAPKAITSDIFKAVVTGDPIQGRDLYQSRYEFRAMAQHLYAANQLPEFKGGIDRGVHRRLLVITFNRSIPMEERIEGIGRRIAAEEPDLLLAWAVEGASRLLRHGEFTIPRSCHDALLEWVLSDDPVAAWIDACVTAVPIVDGGPMIATREAYNSFISWAGTQGYQREKLPAINGFVQSVQARVTDIQSKRRSGGRVFIGIRVTL